jgi:hypothetical protein
LSENGFRERVAFGRHWEWIDIPAQAELPLIAG